MGELYTPYTCPNCNTEMSFKKVVIFEREKYDIWDCEEFFTLVFDWRLKK